MDKLTLLEFAFIGLLAATPPHVHAGSAVAIEPHHGRMATAYGGPVLREQQRALANARSLYGSGVNSWSPRMNQAIVSSGPRRKGTGWLLLFLLPRNRPPPRKPMFWRNLPRLGASHPGSIPLALSTR